MTAPGARAVSAFLVEAEDDEGTVERASVSRSEALELAERFWTATQGYAAGRVEEGVELTLSFTRHQEDDFIELTAFGPEDISVRCRYVDDSKLFGLIPTRDRGNLLLPLRGHDEVIALVEAYMTSTAPRAFSDWMRGRGASRMR